MEFIKYPKKSDWTQYLQRAQLEAKDLSVLVDNIFQQVKVHGDKAVLEYTETFDKVQLTEMIVTAEEIAQSEQLLAPDLKLAIQQAKNNIETFHATQMENIQYTETMPGVTCWRKSIPIENVGLYIPGGTAPLFSTVLMLGVPAVFAKCTHISLCSPPDKNGNIHPAILYAASISGIRNIYKVGGIQAIAAMTVGTESIDKVDKLFGPGNQYVTAAKQMALNYGVAIDMPAGPSEVLVIADSTTPPEFIAADLLSQAEHGSDSQVILLSNDEKTIEATLNQINIQLESLPRKAVAEAALMNSKAVLLHSLDECMEFSNQYAPEHLIVSTEMDDYLANKIINAGSVFLGPYSCESIGDYASGTNHTLPTYGYARNYSGVSLDSFVKKVTFQRVTAEGIKKIGPITEVMAEAEQLLAHKNAVTIRLNHLN